MGRLNLLRFASEIEFVFIGNSQTGVKYRTLDTTNSQVKENNCRTKSVSELNPLVATGEIT